MAGRSSTSSAARGYGEHHRRLRRAVLERDGYRCHWCGGRADQSDHHPVPLALGGPTTMANLVASCGPCNARRGGQLGAATRTRRRFRPSRSWYG